MKPVSPAIDALKQIVALIEPLNIADRRWLIDYITRTALEPAPPPKCIRPCCIMEVSPRDELCEDHNCGRQPYGPHMKSLCNRAPLPAPSEERGCCGAPGGRVDKGTVWDCGCGGTGRATKGAK